MDSTFLHGRKLTVVLNNVNSKAQSKYLCK